MTTPRSIRFDADVVTRLASYVARHPGLSSSSVAARLVDEGLRMEEHPGVVFRDGPIGRRAALIGGPDVWEAIRAVRSARSAEPDLDESELLEMLADNTGISVRQLHTAVAYWADYPDDVDALVEHADYTEFHTAEAHERATNLMAR